MLVQWNDGNKFEVCALVGSDGPSHVKRFLTSLDDGREAAKMLKLIERFADRGRIYNKKKCRAIKGEKNLYEFKEGRLRIMFFYDPYKRRRVILTHGFLKNTGPPVKNDIRRAKRLRQSYIDAIEE